MLEELAHVLDRLVSQLGGVVLAQVEPADGALDRLFERPVAVERRQHLGRSQLELEVGAGAFVEHDANLLDVAVAVELLVEPHLLGERHARFEDRRRALLGDQGQGGEDALDLVARELELVLVRGIGAHHVVVARPLAHQDGALGDPTRVESREVARPFVEGGSHRVRDRR